MWFLFCTHFPASECVVDTVTPLTLAAARRLTLDAFIEFMLPQKKRKAESLNKNCYVEFLGFCFSFLIIFHKSALLPRRRPSGAFGGVGGTVVGVYANTGGEHSK